MEKSQPTNKEDAAAGNPNAIRHVAYSEGYSEGALLYKNRAAKLEKAIREALEQARRYPWASGSFILILENGLKP